MMKIRLRVKPALLPLQAELRNTGTMVQWRIGDRPWQDLIEIDDINASIEVGTVDTLPPGAPVTVVNVGTPQNAIFNFAIPSGQGPTARGEYDPDEFYNQGDTVILSGSSWIARSTVGPGNPPPTLPVTANVYWALLAQKGEDATGDVGGPAAVVADRIAVFDGTTGKLIKDGGKLVAELVAGPASAVNDRIAVFDGVTGKLIKDSGATIASLVPPLPTRYWDGFQHSNSVGSPNTQIDIGAGSARDSTDTANIILAAGTLNLATTGANGLDTGILANNTWYYTFAIATAAGVTARLASTSPTAPTLPGTYTKFRRIGSFKTNGSAQVLPFFHVNDTWYWMTAIRDVSTGATVGTSFVTSAALSVPRVLGVTALFAVTAFHASTAFTFFIAPTFVTDAVGDGFAYNLGTNNGGSIPGRVAVNASSQVKYRSTVTSTTIVIDTAGWVDPL